MSLFIAFLLFLHLANASCVRLDRECLLGTKTFYQINNATNYYSFYVDEVTSSYSDNTCSGDTALYQVIMHRTYDTSFCMGKAESIWYKVLNYEDPKQKEIVDNCGSSLKKEFVDITTLDCKVNGVDPFASLKAVLNSQLYSCIRFNNKQPEIAGTTPSNEKCDSDYDRGSSWISSFMIVMYVILAILAVCTVVLIVFVLVHPNKKNMKKQSKV